MADAETTVPAQKKSDLPVRLASGTSTSTACKTRGPSSSLFSAVGAGVHAFDFYRARRVFLYSPTTHRSSILIGDHRILDGIDFIELGIKRMILPVSYGHFCIQVFYQVDKVLIF